MNGLRCSTCGVLKLGFDLTVVERDRFLGEHRDGDPQEASPYRSAAVRHDVEIWETVDGSLVWRSARPPFAVGVSLEAWIARFNRKCVCRGNPFLKCECPCWKCRERMFCIDL